MARFPARTPVRGRHSAIARWTAHSMQPNRPQDLARTTLQLIALGALMLSSFWIVRLVLLVPFYFGLTAIVENARQIADWSKSLGTVVLPQPPAWLAGVPAIGSKLAERWQHLAAASPEEVSARLSPFARGMVLWFVGQVGSLGLLLVQFLLTVIVVAILYSNGETVTQGADRFARRLAGTQGERSE